MSWFHRAPEEQFYLPSVMIGEIQAGIEITREQDAPKARDLEEWLGRLMDDYRVLPVDAAAFREWDKLMRRQSDTLLLDAMIAAVAIVNGFTVVTRNARDLEAIGVETLNPFIEPSE